MLYTRNHLKKRSRFSWHPLFFSFPYKPKNISVALMPLHIHACVYRRNQPSSCHADEHQENIERRQGSRRDFFFHTSLFFPDIILFLRCLMCSQEMLLRDQSGDEKASTQKDLCKTTLPYSPSIQTVREPNMGCIYIF